MSYDTEEFPYDTVVKITDTIGGVGYQGSGVLVSPDEVLTATHVVYIAGAGSANNIVVTPGTAGYGNAPFGSADGDYIHYYDINDQNRSISLLQTPYDFALIHLGSSFSGLGYMGMLSDYGGGPVNVTGYPASAEGDQQTSLQDVYLADPNVFAGLTLGEGSSGGPVWIDGSQGPQVVGVVSSAIGETGYFGQLSSAVFDQIESWISQDAQGNGEPRSPIPNYLSGSDILFRDAATGDTGWYQVSGGNSVAWADFGATSPAYAVVGTGNFTGSATSELLFRNASTGDTGFYAPTASGYTWDRIGDTSTDYSVVGTGDFTGSGSDKVLFQDSSTGDLGYFSLSDSAPATWQDLGQPSLLYSVVGTGDFNGSGTAQILFRDNGSGDIGYYTINSGGEVTGWTHLGGSSTAYAVVGVGDLTGSGTTDILFRDDATGDFGYYAVANGNQVTWEDLGGSSPAYSVVQLGDFTGNGASDILFRDNATGDAGYYTVNSSGQLGGWTRLGGSSPEYSVIASPTFS